MPEPLDIEQVLARAKHRVVTVGVCVAGDLLGRHQELEEQLVQARIDDEREDRHALAPGIARKIEELEAEIAQARVPFTFRAIGRRAWSDLMTAFPPSEEDRRNGAGYDKVMFEPAAIAASCVSPVMTVEQVERLGDVLNEGQWMVLLGGCLAANVEGRDPFSVAAFVTLHGSETKYEPPGITE
jgi:hypothetical protein